VPSGACSPGLQSRGVGPRRIAPGWPGYVPRPRRSAFALVWMRLVRYKPIAKLISGNW